MNQKFKIKLVALMAVVSWAGPGASQAMQAFTSTVKTVGSGDSETSESSSARAFGAVQSAKSAGNGLPPIVSAADHLSNQVQVSALPPIVTPDKNPAYFKHRQAEPIAPQAQSAKSNTLAPLAPLAPTIKASVAASPTQIATSASLETQAVAIEEEGREKETQQVQYAAQWQASPKPINGVSSAGVPLYSQATAAGFTSPIASSTDKPLIVSNSKTAINTPPPIIQGVSTASRSSQLLQSPNAPIIRSNSTLIAPKNSTIASPAKFSVVKPSPPVVQGSGSRQPLSTPVVQGSGTRQPLSAPVTQGSGSRQPLSQDPSYFSSPVGEAPVISSVDTGCASCSDCGGGGCSECGVAASQHGCVAGCQSCASGDCFDSSQVAAQFDNCGFVTPARRYLIADALYFGREDDSITASNFGSLNSFDGEAGWQITLGNRDDATSGREVTYFGTDEFTESAVRNSATGLINATFVPGSGFSAAQISAFNGATQLTESASTEIHSLEFNRVRWGWDVFKSYVGLRFIYFEDDYDSFSQSPVIDPITNAVTGVETGTLRLGAINNLIGPHWGSELFYDVGNRLSWSFASKVGVYANINQFDTQLINNGVGGVTPLIVEDDEVTIAGSIELGLNGHYQLSERARFRFGYSILWLTEVATVADNFPEVITPSTGANSSDSDDVFFHGLRVGLEIYR